MTNLLTDLERRIAEHFPCHPFAFKVNRDNFEDVIAEYLAMSIAFPYLQAGAVYANYRRVTESRGDTDENLEITAAIASFLVWDEFGGLTPTQHHEKDGLHWLTRVGQNLHSNLLRRDIEILMGRKIEPKWSRTTTEYLNALLDGLSDGKNNRNIAYMISFEMHAHTMIQSMWQSICKMFGPRKATDLQYFYRHVGGDFPAEAFHVEMTRKMISLLVPEQSREEFLSMCINAYAANIRWCEALVTSHSSGETTKHRYEKDAQNNHNE